jgi:surfactin synthase thioesterase subunit
LLCGDPRHDRSALAAQVRVLCFPHAGGGERSHQPEGPDTILPGGHFFLRTAARQMTLAILADLEAARGRPGR